MTEWDLGPASSLRESGDFLTGEAYDVPILVVKGWDGQVRAFVNRCLHQSVKLEWDAKGNCDSVLECPFHGWTYDFEGRNLSPGWGEEMKLYALSVREHEDRLLVSVTDAARQLAKGIQ